MNPLKKPLKKPFSESKATLWEKLYAELNGEFRYPPKEGQNTSAEVHCGNWKLKLSINNDPSDPGDPGPSVLINPMGVGGMGF